jgi:hypothetical protein
MFLKNKFLRAGLKDPALLNKRQKTTSQGEANVF